MTSTIERDDQATPASIVGPGADSAARYFRAWWLYIHGDAATENEPGPLNARAGSNGWDMSRAIDAFLNGRLLAGLVVAILASIVFAPYLARRLRIVRPVAYLAALAVTLIVAITIFERLEGVPGFDLTQALTWWTDSRQPLIEVARTEAAWWLNVALFVPAGLVWAVATKRPLKVAASLAAFSFAIETLQGLAGLGAADLTDLVANTLGGALGASVIGFALHFAPGMVPDVTQSRSNADEGHVSTRWILGSIAATLIVAGLGYGGVQTILTVRQSALRGDVEQTFDGLTIGDINAIRDAGSIGLDPFFVLEAGPPDSYRFYGDDRPAAVRYSIDFVGFYRCVFVTFSLSPPVFADGSGDVCTEDRYEE